MFSEKNIIRNNGSWGNEIANQEMFLAARTRIEEEAKEQKKNSVLYTRAFMYAVKNGKDSFKFNGKEVPIFK